MHITPYKAMYFPNFIFLRKRLKSSHTSLKKIQKEDFNSINRYFISSLTNASPPGELAFETLTNCSYYTFFLANRCVRSSREPSSVLIR